MIGDQPSAVLDVKKKEQEISPCFHFRENSRYRSVMEMSLAYEILM